jgi:chemotaxis protein CheZ
MPIEAERMSRTITNEDILRSLLKIGAGLHRDFSEFRDTLKVAALTINEKKFEEAKHLARELEDLSNHILNTKREIALISVQTDGGNFQSANFELDAVVKQTEDATNNIMTAAENISALSNSLTEIEDPVARAAKIDKINDEVVTIYESCNFQDITGQRIRKIVRMLTYIETRIENMVRIWGASEIGQMTAGAAEEERAAANDEADLLNGPQLPGAAVSQTEIDDFFR